jgi:hypothetical protein
LAGRATQIGGRILTPAGILFCTTLVTTVPHGSIAQNNCRYFEPPFSGTQTTAAEVPVQKDVVTSDVLPIASSIKPAVTPSIAQPIASPITKTAEPVARPPMRVAKFFKSKMKMSKLKTRRKIAHLATFRGYGQIVVSPAGNEIPKKKERLSFWEELKRFDLLN